MLLQNGYRDAFTGVRFFGAGTTNGAYPYISNANSQTVGAQRNFFASDASILSTTSLPDGCRHPVAWMMPQKPGGLSTRNSITGSGSLAAAILAVKLAQADLTGNGELAAIGGLIVQLIADLEGDGTISSADVKAFLAAVANIGGSGGMTDADLEGLGALISAITGSGTAAGSTVTATGQLDADLTVTGTGLSTANVGAAVWAALAAVNNATGTMGEKLNDAGAAGNPWAALTASNNDPATFGELMQAMQTLMDELHKIHGLSSGNPMTVTTTTRSAGGINQTISGNGTTTSTVTRT